MLTCFSNLLNFYYFFEFLFGSTIIFMNISWKLVGFSGTFLVFSLKLQRLRKKTLFAQIFLVFQFFYFFVILENSTIFVKIVNDNFVHFRCKFHEFWFRFFFWILDFGFFWRQIGEKRYKLKHLSVKIGLSLNYPPHLINTKFHFRRKKLKKKIKINIYHNSLK